MVNFRSCSPIFFGKEFVRNWVYRHPDVPIEELWGILNFYSWHRLSMWSLFQTCLSHFKDKIVNVVRLKTSSDKNFDLSHILHIVGVSLSTCSSNPFHKLGHSWKIDLSVLYPSVVRSLSIMWGRWCDHPVTLSDKYIEKAVTFGDFFIFSLDYSSFIRNHVASLFLKCWHRRWWESIIQNRCEIEQGN